MIKAQDMYILGLRLHQEIVKRKIHTVSAGEGQAGFDRVWCEALTVVQSLVVNGEVDLIDPCQTGIDWRYQSLAELEPHRPEPPEIQDINSGVSRREYILMNGAED